MLTTTIDATRRIQIIGFSAPLKGFVSSVVTLSDESVAVSFLRITMGG